MEVNVVQLKRTDIVKAKGRIDSATAPKLADAMDAIVKAGRYHIIFDMSEVEYMSSAGLRILISTQNACKRHAHGELVLASVPERIHEALELAGFVPLFTFYDQVEQAVGSV